MGRITKQDLENSLKTVEELLKETQEELQKLKNERDLLSRELEECEAEKEKLQKQCNEMISGKYWEPTKNERGAGRKSIITDKLKNDVNINRASGMTIKEISEKIGISTGLVHKILNS